MTRPADDRPTVSFKGIHIPPEDAAFIAMLLLEAAGTFWRKERAKWNQQKVSMQRNLEYALGNEGGFTSLLRQSRLRRRR